MKCSISGEKPSGPSPGIAALPSSVRRLRWMWQELPSASLYLAMKLRLMPCFDAISLAPDL